MERFDVIVIGFGNGGKFLAGSLAAQGQRVAFVEKSDMMYGGTCPNVGCVPTKFLVNRAEMVRIKRKCVIFMICYMKHIARKCPVKEQFCIR